MPPLTQSPKRFMLATSTQGRPIELSLFQAPNAAEDIWDTFFIGVFHGDEGIAGALSHCLVEQLSREPLAAMAERTVAVLPVLNPDGLEAKTRVNANGVDLNRNFPTQNWSPDCEDPHFHPGPAPASEVETQLIVELIEKHRPRKIITLHSPYKVVNYDGLQSKALAELMGQKSGYPAVEDIGYPTPGSFGTYAGKERDILVITLELPEDEPLNQVWQDTREALLEAIRF